MLGLLRTEGVFINPSVTSVNPTDTLRSMQVFMNPTIHRRIMGINPAREAEISQGISSTITWVDSTGKEKEVIVPPTVYPPREDTTMFHKALLKVKGEPGRLLEIGTGCGVIGSSMAENGWEVCGIDINPLAIVSARGNHQNTGKFESIEMDIEEINNDFKKDWDVIAWNTPYLDSPDKNQRLGPLEEAALSWEGKHPIRKLLNLGNIQGMLAEKGCILALISAGEQSSQELNSAISEGWSVRTIETRSQGGERTAVIALWKGWKWDPIRKNSVSSTMTILDKNDHAGACIISQEQTAGRGRNNSTWISKKGDLTGTWKIIGPKTPILDVQSIHMAASLAVINSICTWKGRGLESIHWINQNECQYSVKWPNDIVCQASNTKVAGILLHAESKGDQIWISCGIGINSSPRMVDGNICEGVSESGLDNLEKHLHCHLSSWFENHERVPDVDTSFLRRRWWSAASYSQIIGKGKIYRNEPCVVSKLMNSKLQIYSKSGNKEITGIEIHD